MSNAQSDQTTTPNGASPRTDAIPALDEMDYPDRWTVVIDPLGRSTDEIQLYYPSGSHTPPAMINLFENEESSDADGDYTLTVYDQNAEGSSFDKHLPTAKEKTFDSHAEARRWVGIFAEEFPLDETQ